MRGVQSYKEFRLLRIEKRKGFPLLVLHGETNDGIEFYREVLITNPYRSLEELMGFSGGSCYMRELNGEIGITIDIHALLQPPLVLRKDEETLKLSPHEFRVIGDKPIENMSFEDKKKFRKTHGYDRISPWGNIEGLDPGISTLVKKINQLPFAYTFGFSCSGLPSDHEGREDYKQTPPYLTLVLDPDNDASQEFLISVLETGIFKIGMLDTCTGEGRIRIDMIVPEEFKESEKEAFVRYGWSELEKLVNKFIQI